MPAASDGRDKRRREFTRRLHAKRNGSFVEAPYSPSSNGFDPQVVRTKELAVALSLFLDDHNRQHGDNNSVWGDEEGEGSISAMEHLSIWSGVTKRQIRTIMAGSTQSTALGIADALLTAVGLEYLLRVDVEVIPNPLLSYESYIRFMRSRGCL